MPDAVALAMVEALPSVAPTVGWQTFTTTAATGAVSGAAVSTDGTNIYVSHGFRVSANAPTNILQVIPPSAVRSDGPSTSVARQGVAGAWCNGKHYAIGGLGSGNSIQQTSEAYTPAGTNGASGVWSTPAAPPYANAYASAAAIGNSIYLAGGQASNSAANAVATLARYDSTNNTWSTLANMPAARTQGAMVAVASKLYYLGGRDSSGTATNTVYVFDTTAGTWSSATPIGQSLTSSAIPWVAVGSLLYMVSSNSTYTYDTATGVTSGNLGARPVAHGLHAGAVVIASAIYHVSGADTANVDKLDLGAGVGYTSAVLGVKSLLNPLLAGVAATLPNTPPTATADRNAYAQTVQTLEALTYIS